MQNPKRPKSETRYLRWYKTQKYSHIILPLVGFSLRVCLFGGILRRIENWEEKSGEKVVLVDVWLGGGEKKMVVDSDVFSPPDGVCVGGRGISGEAQCIELMKMPMEGWQFYLYKRFMSRKFASPIKPNIISFKFFTITKIVEPLLCCFALLSLGRKKKNQKSRVNSKFPTQSFMILILNV